jgi:hypothetical protein
MIINRRELLCGIASTTVLYGTATAAELLAHLATVGAIRWDPWYIQTASGPRVTMEYCLGPSKWHDRAPSCALFPTRETVSFANCGTQARIDLEIALARAANLDYWAYVWYGYNDPMQTAWRLHQSSRLVERNGIDWCMLFNGYAFFTREMAAQPNRYVTSFRDPRYHKISGGRPLVYLLPDNTTYAALQASIRTLRAACQMSNMNPYIVLLVGAHPGAVAAAGADAIGIYSKAWAAPSNGVYPQLTQAVEAYWQTQAATGQEVVPTAMTGGDKRPRIQRPVPWEPWQKPGVGIDLYYAAGTPAQIATHVGNMVSWIKTSPACVAKTGLIYSWDEHDEGGSTLSPSIGTGSQILTAVGDVLRSDRFRGRADGARGGQADGFGRWGGLYRG